MRKPTEYENLLITFGLDKRFVRVEPADRFMMRVVYDYGVRPDELPNLEDYKFALKENPFATGIPVFGPGGTITITSSLETTYLVTRIDAKVFVPQEEVEKYKLEIEAERHRAEMAAIEKAQEALKNKLDGFKTGKPAYIHMKDIDYSPSHSGLSGSVDWVGAWDEDTKKFWEPMAAESKEKVEPAGTESSTEPPSTDSAGWTERVVEFKRASKLRELFDRIKGAKK